MTNTGRIDAGDSITGRRLMPLVITTALLLLIIAGGGALYYWRPVADREPIKVGILHSLTGPISITEQGMVDGELLAIEQLNANGGLLGRRIEPVIADGRSDWPAFAREAERLITQEKVCVIFGCCTSASRKTVRPVIERHNHLLVYPAGYEGLEQSPNIIYTGAAPNQHIIPAVKWSCDHLGKRFFLAGSDYVWPHSINAITKDVLHALGAEVVGEQYLFFGSSDVGFLIEEIKKTKPDVIFSSIVGDSNIAFYKALHEAGFTPEKLPVISVSLGEEELDRIPAKYITGDYCTADYFQNFRSPENEKFVRDFKKRYGEDRSTSDAIETSYFSVLLWAQAVREAGTTNVQQVRKSMLGQSLDAPEGVVSIDPATQHTWRSISIGRIREDGLVDVVWTSEKPIRPAPYPLSRSKAEWDAFLLDLYTRWGGSWANPVDNH
jgi:urea transport system substrate-binding protein